MNTPWIYAVFCGNRGYTLAIAVLLSDFLTVSISRSS
jgi:hypothetical protein